MMLFLLSSDPLVSGSPFFMVEAVDFTVESPKCVGTQIEQGVRSPYSKLQKPDYLVSKTAPSGFVDFDNNQGRYWHR
jgi:hypothetical protein